ncbi:zinc transporter 2-like isoform X2 [Chrysoperla carnea]|uniref:zinc transporter 2-like isoform X2 n=1 Tax=Chrysoperla carnea TaxID=189513 RepID=UPI001D08DD42|nr:zinc transporter 2-like isoform X2 [Chrysoperla carnea]
MITCDEKENLILYRQQSGSRGLYGSVTSNTSGTPKSIIYCVHGRPSTGCCTVSEGEIIDPQSEDQDPIISFKNTNQILSADHCHRSRNEEIDKKARRKLLIASILCVLFMVCEVVGGVLSSSLAIATDAAHLLTDFASFMISLFSLWMATRPATQRMPFGWYRAEVIGALTSVLMIWVVTGILVYMAIQRIIEDTYEIDATIMLITSGFGVLVNIVMGLTLHQHGHTHGGGSSHSHGRGSSHHDHSKPSSNKPGESHIDPTSLVGDKSKQEGHATSDVESAVHANEDTNINVRAAYIHVLGDIIQSLGVLIAAVIIFFKPEWRMVDPICTFLFSILVLATTYAIIKDTLLVLMEGMPRGIEFVDVMNTFLNIDGVVRVHNLRIWALSLDKTALSAHLAIKPGVSPQSILQFATRLVHQKYDFFEMTLQIEEFQPNMENCSQCKLPP